MVRWGDEISKTVPPKVQAPMRYLIPREQSAHVVSQTASGMNGIRMEAKGVLWLSSTLKKKPFGEKWIYMFSCRMQSQSIMRRKCKRSAIIRVCTAVDNEIYSGGYYVDFRESIWPGLAWSDYVTSAVLYTSGFPPRSHISPPPCCHKWLHALQWLHHLVESEGQSLLLIPQRAISEGQGPAHFPQAEKRNKSKE